MNENNNKNIARSSLKMSLVTTISRVFGLVRDQIQAIFLGTSFIADAFAIGFILPNLLRRLFAEGNMVASFIPVFTDVENNEGIKEAKIFFSSVFTLLLIILFFVVLLGMFLSPLLVNILYTSGRTNIEAINLAVNLSRIMFPYLLFISLASLEQGVLNTRNIYSIPAASPILLNISIITLAMLNNVFLKYFPNIAYVFAMGVLIGGFIQFAYMIPFIIKQGFSFTPILNFKNKNVIKMIKLFVPGIFGASIYQINLLVSTAFAGFIGEGRVSALTFATRLHEFTLGVFAVSIATVMLPTLSRLISSDKIYEARDTLSYSLRLIALITIPASFGFIMLGNEIVILLFGYGKFSIQSANLVFNALSYMSISLFFVASYRILVQSFYAMKDMKTPVYIAVMTFSINFMLNILLVYVFKLDIKAIAISSTVANTFSFFVLYYLLKDKMLVRHILGSKVNIIKTLLSSIIMSMAVFSMKYYLAPSPDNRQLFILKIILIIIVSVLVYITVNVSLKNEDLKSLFNILIKRARKK